jgi:hypothetical protein
MILNEVGLEMEMFLVDYEGNILEPMKYGFPSDEMGFLIEIRSEHSSRKEDIVSTLENLAEINTRKAEVLGFRVEKVPYKTVSPEFQEYISEKYKHYTFPDHTKNLYGRTGPSHHTGFKDNLATAGLHVHFSSRIVYGTKCVQKELPVDKIVKYMDQKFSREIKEAYRIPGEYEMKSHGFEYRSLPNNIDVGRAVTVALQILEETK